MFSGCRRRCRVAFAGGDAVVVSLKNKFSVSFVSAEREGETETEAPLSVAIVK